MTRHPYTVARVPIARAAGAPSVMDGVYAGTELQPFTGRPGAMAAFALPSRMGRRLHFRDGSVQELSAVAGVDIGADRMTFGPVTMYYGSPPCAGFAHPLSRRTEIDA